MDMKQTIIILCFLVFGIIMGICTGWHNQRGYDTPFLLNIPGYMIGDVFQGLWARFIGGTLATAPWILGRPQVFILASILFWGLLGTLLAIFVKFKILAWIVSIYLVIFGGLTIWYFA
jgi:hypothetical protein